MSVWDDPELKMNDDFVKLENVGDEIRGTIVNLRPHRFEDGSVAVQIIFTDARDGQERTWSAGQVQAKKRLAEIRPEVGWEFRARLDSIEKRAGGKTLKHIDVQARPGNGAPPAAPAQESFTASATSSQAFAAPTGIDPATWSAMSPDQRTQMLQALGLQAPQAAPAGAFTDEPPF